MAPTSHLTSSASGLSEGDRRFIPCGSVVKTNHGPRAPDVNQVPASEEVRRTAEKLFILYCRSQSEIDAQPERDGVPISYGDLMG